MYTYILTNLRKLFARSLAFRREVKILKAFCVIFPTWWVIERTVGVLGEQKKFKELLVGRRENKIVWEKEATNYTLVTSTLSP